MSRESSMAEVAPKRTRMGFTEAEKALMLWRRQQNGERGSTSAGSGQPRRHENFSRAPPTLPVSRSSSASPSLSSSSFSASSLSSSRSISSSPPRRHPHHGHSPSPLSTQPALTSLVPVLDWRGQPILREAPPSLSAAGEGEAKRKGDRKRKKNEKREKKRRHKHKKKKKEKQPKAAKEGRSQRAEPRPTRRCDSSSGAGPRGVNNLPSWMHSGREDTDRGEGQASQRGNATANGSPPRTGRRSRDRRSPGRRSRDFHSPGRRSPDDCVRRRRRLERSLSADSCGEVGPEGSQVASESSGATSRGSSVDSLGREVRHSATDSPNRSRLPRGAEKKKRKKPKKAPRTDSINQRNHCPSPPPSFRGRSHSRSISPASLARMPAPADPRRLVDDRDRDRRQPAARPSSSSLSHHARQRAREGLGYRGGGGGGGGWRSRSRSRSPSRFSRRRTEAAAAAAAEEEERPWTHDGYIECVLREPSPERAALPQGYAPPQPEWFSRAGGVYIPNRAKPANAADAPPEAADALRALAVYGVSEARR